MYNYPCKVVRVIDGDTAVLEVDLGFNIRFTETFRLLGINAPEKRGISKQLGCDAQDHLEELIEKHKPLLAYTKKDKKGKYGRYLVTLIGSETHVNLNVQMVYDGHAVEANY